MWEGAMVGVELMVETDKGAVGTVWLKMRWRGPLGQPHSAS